MAGAGFTRFGSMAVAESACLTTTSRSAVCASVEGEQCVRCYYIRTKKENAKCLGWCKTGQCACNSRHSGVWRRQRISMQAKAQKKTKGRQKGLRDAKSPESVDRWCPSLWRMRQAEKAILRHRRQWARQTWKQAKGLEWRKRWWCSTGRGGGRTSLGPGDSGAVGGGDYAFSSSSSLGISVSSSSVLPLSSRM
jgi:hypothetical protein